MPLVSPPPSNILVRGVNWLGDAVMTTPALRRLREAYPGARITLLTQDKLADLWTGHRAVDRILTFAKGEGAWKLGRRLRAKRFDLGLILPNSPRSALELWLAGIPERVGYAHSWRNWFLSRAIQRPRNFVRMRKRSVEEIQHLIQGNQSPEPPPPASAHHLFHYLNLVAVVGANPEPLPPALDVDDAEVARAAEKFGFAADLESKRPVLGLNPGAEYGPAKRWPRERFVAAAVEVHRLTDCRWLVLGGKGDLELASGIASEIRQACGESSVLQLTGATSLRELCAVLKACRVVLTNDTGPMHVAAAVGAPVVVPFGSTSPELTGPGLPGEMRHELLKSDAPCAPCFLRECPIDFRCMRGIEVERVVAAMMRAMERG